MSERIDIDKPLWDLSTFNGRLKHYLWMTDPRTCLVSESQLDEAKILVEQYKRNEAPSDIPIEKVLYAKQLYESAFHPDTREKQNLFGRMSFQVPGNMLITGAMLQFYKSAPAVLFWQWFNQSFNALVNYTNRNANIPVSKTQLSVAYVSATSSALISAFALKKYLANTKPIFQRFVPFAAVAAANCVNIPLMRQNEILCGVDLTDENGNPVNAKSKIASVKGISQVIFSRITMCAPGMVILPVIMERLERQAWMKRITILHMPIQVVLLGCFLAFTTPFGCALFPQNCSVHISTLERFEPEEHEKLKKQFGDNLPQLLYFNKGL
ncbi:sideroflexin-2-like [Chrysoperla carnea]|uniref:sideroflexin-2-like n=1 Tax=Chrysoperla carnea TaxID=189513 RepID=UPI001D085DDD|nr:sideroflexin-2-like [Chrysoperla carnea]